MAWCEHCKTIPILNIPDAARLVQNYARVNTEPKINYWVPDEHPHAGHLYHSISSLELSAQQCPLCEILWPEVELNAQTWDQASRATPQVVLDHRDVFCPRDRPLRITKMVDSASGFAIVLSAPDFPLDLALANVLMAVEYASPYASKILARPFGDQVVCKESLAWIQTCIDQCQLHKSCKSNHYRPRRLLDLRTRNGHIRLTEDVPHKPRYAALSYCWGTDPFLTTREQTILKHKEGIPVDSLPRTMSDAITVALGLGIEYLWIDALCIIQDSFDDWEQQSVQMSDIYGGAYLTITAQDGTYANEQIVTELPAKQRRRVSFPLDQSHSAELCVVGLRDWLPRDMLFSSLNSRAWCFQERILSRRCVFVREHELIYECRNVFRSQSGYLVDGPQLQASLDGVAIISGQASQRARWRAWKQIILSYNSRALTVPTDKFPALTGVAKRFQRLTDARYLAGIWSDSILHSLIFTRDFGPDMGSSKVMYASYIAPSWSWAAWYGNAIMHEYADESYISKLIDCDVQLGSANLYGQVTGGHLRLSSPLVKLKTHPHLQDRIDEAVQLGPDSWMYRAFFEDFEGEQRRLEVMTDHPVKACDSAVNLNNFRRTHTDATPENIDLYALILCWSDHVWKRVHLRGEKIPAGNQLLAALIVTPDGKAMQRVGTVVLYGENLKSWDALDLVNFTTVTLI